MAADRFSTGDQLMAQVRTLVDKVRAVPGVRGAAATDALPLEGFGNGMPFLIAGRDVIDRANRQACGFKMVQADYFSVLGIQVIKGRAFTDRDVKGSPRGAVINQVTGRRRACTSPISSWRTASFAAAIHAASACSCRRSCPANRTSVRRFRGTSWA